MPKFTLIAEHTDLQGNPDGTKVTYECYVDVLDDVLEHFDLFVRGCGYNPTGTLDYISYDSLVQPTDLGEQILSKSNHYFDTERNK